MKKTALLFLGTMILICIPGCSSKPKANMMMRCTYMNSSADTGRYTSTADFTYIKETDELVNGNIVDTYVGYPKDQYNNKVLTDMTIQKSKFDELEGVEMSLIRTESEFGSKIVWDYQNIDLDDALQFDKEQKQFIDLDAGVYSYEKTRNYYESNNYTCSISDIDK